MILGACLTVAVLMHRRFMQHGQRSGQIVVPGPDGAGPRQGKADDAVEGSGAGQDKAVSKQTADRSSR
jgi:hypothetical protein